MAHPSPRHQIDWILQLFRARMERRLGGMDRRTFLESSSLAAGAVVCGVPGRKTRHPVEIRSISQQPDKYHGWPTVARRSDGELLLVCSGGRQRHVCPFGRVELMTSRDQGKTWTWPRVILDGVLDDRDAGVVETKKGSLLVTSFSSLAYVPGMQRMSNQPAAWQAAHARGTAEQRKAALGTWMCRSEDGGLNWSGRYDSIVNSPHGPINLKDGRLLYAGKRLWTDQRNGVCISEDDGKSFEWVCEIPTRDGDKFADYHELHAVELEDGRIVVQIRNHNPANHRETLQCHSTDGGKTFSTPRSIGVWGLPSHLLGLRDGRILMSYGHRRKPFGNQARVSEDGGKTWSQPIAISADGAGGDLGYPSTVELSDGRLLSVWYEKLAGSQRAVLRQGIWSLPG